MSCPIVTTKYGKVKGSIARLRGENGKLVYIYRSIPFAKPPVGNLRFESPQPVQTWTDIRDGLLLPNIPMGHPSYDNMMKLIPMKNYDQNAKIKSEDCLYLSIYKPAISEECKLPVMVWFYGGAFQTGSEALYDGTALAGMNDVIVVVPNYRLSVFGFLALGKSSPCPGNLGLLDQNFALQWVRDNIECFGGDKDNVTIFGESAGGISVDMHLMSHMSRGLYHKAISHSGQALMSVLFNTEKKREEIVRLLKEKLQLSVTEDTELLKSLKKIPAEKLIKCADELEQNLGILFQPVVDGVFLRQSPQKYYDEGDFAHVPYIIGFNNTEGSGLMSMIASPEDLNVVTEEKIKEIRFVPKNDRVISACKKFYIKDDQDPSRYSKLVGEIIMDTMFAVPALIAAKTREEAKIDIYMYLGAYQLRMHHDEAYGKDMVKKPDWCICDHTDDLFMTLGVPFIPGEMPYGAKLSEKEATLSRKFMTYITNFAKHGDPNKGEAVELNWPKYKTAEGGEHLVLDHKLSIGKSVRQKEFSFWTETIALRYLMKCEYHSMDLIDLI